MNRPIGCALAMRVMQSDLYLKLDEAERADCDELVRQNLEWFAQAAPRGWCKKCGSRPLTWEHKRPDGSDCPYIATGFHMPGDAKDRLAALLLERKTLREWPGRNRERIEQLEREIAALHGADGVRACDEGECRAAERDSIICAGECEVASGKRTDGVIASDHQT